MLRTVFGAAPISHAMFWSEMVCGFCRGPTELAACSWLFLGPGGRYSPPCPVRNRIRPTRLCRLPNPVGTARQGSRPGSRTESRGRHVSAPVAGGAADSDCRGGLPLLVSPVCRRMAPQTRDIHIEAYRYGFSPSRIKANRGDRLRLTFSTRDTGQSFFFQDYDLHVSITPGNKMVSVQRLSHPDDPPVLMETVEIMAGLPGWQGWLDLEIAVSQSYLQWPVARNRAGGIDRRAQLPAVRRPGAVGRDSVCRADPGAPPDAANGPDRRVNLFRIFPWLKRILKAPSFQFNLALPMLGVFWFIILAGLFGTKVAGRNAGPMIIWVLWLSGPDHPAGAHRRQDLVHGLSAAPAGGMAAAAPPHAKSGGAGRQIAAPHIRRAARSGPPGSATHGRACCSSFCWEPSAPPSWRCLPPPVGC